MDTATFSSREFTRDVAAAKRATVDGPVFVTDRGRAAFVPLKIEDYHRLSGRQGATLRDIMEAIAASSSLQSQVGSKRPRDVRRPQAANSDGRNTEFWVR
jgi:PHD/YefM family antitoxin component YafN of YafNO toxin-antitoxin module